MLVIVDGIVMKVKAFEKNKYLGSLVSPLVKNTRLTEVQCLNGDNPTEI